MTQVPDKEPMADRSARLAPLTAKSAVAFVVIIGTISLFSDATYEGGRSIVGQFMQVLGSGAFAVGIAVGAGEFLGYAIRLISGYAADRTGAYWRLMISGYLINLLAMPALAFVGQWQIAIALLFTERIGKAIRNPSRDAMLSFATHEMGRGWGYGLHEAMDQIGAILGPLMVALVLTLRDGDGLETKDYRVAFLTLIIPASIAIFLLIRARFLFPHPENLESKTPKVGAEGLTRRFWALTIASGLVAAGITDFALIAFHLERTGRVSESFIPVIFAIGMAVDAAAALVLGKLFDRTRYVTVYVAVALGALFAPLVYYGSLPVLLIGIGLWGVVISATESIFKAGIAEVVRPDRRAWGFGMFATVFGVFWFAGSALMGFLYDIDPAYLVAFSVASQLAGLVVFFFAGRQQDAVATATGDTS